MNDSTLARRTRRWAVALSLTALLGACAAPGPIGVRPGGLTMAEISNLLTQGRPQKEIADQINQRGLAAQASPDDVSRLEKEGAKSDVIDAVLSASWIPPSTTSSYADAAWGAPYPGYGPYYPYYPYYYNDPFFSPWPWGFGAGVGFGWGGGYYRGYPGGYPGYHGRPGGWHGGGPGRPPGGGVVAPTPRMGPGPGWGRSSAPKPVTPRR